MNRTRKKTGRACLSLLVIVMLMSVLCPAALADTDGTEPQLTQQPDQLILQLGTRWAGVEFELRTDAGVVPAPIVVDSSGVLTMDLGGSKTYTLSCLNSTVPIPDPLTGQGQAVQEPAEPSQDAAADAAQQEKTDANSGNGIPVGTLILFLTGLALAGAGLAALYIAKRRQQSVCDNWEDGDDDEY